MSDEPNLIESEAPDAETMAVAPVVAMTPGQILRITREAQGLSVADVTDVLRFSRRQVEALESDDYESLPGTTVVRGFVRSYSKLLKISPEPLLAAIMPAVPLVTTDVRPPINAGIDEPRRMDGTSFRPWILLLAVLFLAAIGGGLYFMLAGPHELPPAVSAPAEAVVVNPSVAAIAPISDAEPKAESASSDAAAMPPNTALVFEFDALSWVEVRDAAQKIVFVGEYPKGTRQVVEGQAPFQVWIGKSSAVRLSYGGRNIDLKPYTREEVARLVVE